MGMVGVAVQCFLGAGGGPAQGLLVVGRVGVQCVVWGGGGGVEGVVVGVEGWVLGGPVVGR